MPFPIANDFRELAIALPMRASQKSGDDDHAYLHSEWREPAV
jgi:hypothetical protein